MSKAQGAAFNLAITRFVYFSILLWLIGSERYFLNWQKVPAEFWFPTGPLMAFDAPPFRADTHAAIFHFWRWTLPLCALGIGYRIVAPLNFIAAFLLFNYAHSFGYQTHTFMPVLLVGLSLSFAAASDSVSLDCIFFRRIFKVHENARFYEWPLRNAKMTFCLVFFAAGVAKLRASGLEWVTSDTLRNYFLVASIRYEDVNALAHHMRLNQKLYLMPWLCHLLAALALLLELSIPLALFKRSLARVLVPAMFVAQIFIFFAIFVNFQIYLAIYISWINWSWLFKKFNAFRGALHRPAAV